MNLFKSLFTLFLSIFFIFSSVCADKSAVADRIKGSLFGGLIGDCLGKPTEFIKTTDEIFAKFPGGITSFKDLQNFGLTQKNEHGQEYAPYTDDTAMARITLKVLLESKKNDWDLNYTMGQLAIAYAKDVQNPTGWAMSERAPGNCCKRGIREISSRMWKKAWNQDANWWQVGGPDDMGCGSVMRAHPFGIVFADDPEKAGAWAAEHSKITHGHPAALAACAAMAIGTAYAIQGKNTDFIIAQMITGAKKYDPIKTRFNTFTQKTEKSCWGKMEDAVAATKGYREYFDGPYNRLFGPLNSSKPLTEADHLNAKYRYSTLITHMFDIFPGWSADDAIAAATYIFALCPNNVQHAISLGVHTPGDSDSIASMAGALVGARTGYNNLEKYYGDTSVFEGSKALAEYADQAASFFDQCINLH
jgi:ADP-ribosylglycohydrolase